MSIHINPKNKGKFNATKKRTGKTTEELTHSKNPLTRKRAIFALNAKKWKHDDGGYLYTDPPTLLDYLSHYRTPEGKEAYLEESRDWNEQLRKDLRDIKRWENIDKRDRELANTPWSVAGFGAELEPGYDPEYPVLIGEDKIPTRATNELDENGNELFEDADGNLYTREFSNGGNLFPGGGPVTGNGYVLNPYLSNYNLVSWNFQVPNDYYKRAVLDTNTGNYYWETNDGRWVDSAGKLNTPNIDIPIDIYGMNYVNRGNPNVGWHLNWLNNRLPQLAKNITNYDYLFGSASLADALEEANRQINSLKGFTEYSMFDEESPDGENGKWVNGLTNLNKKTIEYLRDPLEANTSTIAHERTHAMRPHAQENAAYKIAKEGEYNPYGWKSLSENPSYYNSPDEIYARLMEARYKYGLSPNQTVTKEMLDNMLEMEDNEYKGFEYSPSILGMFDDETLLRLFNEVAQNDTKQEFNYAANGGNLINNNINNNNMYNKFETGGTKRPQYDKEAWHDYFDTDHLSLNDEPEYYAGRIPEVTIRPLEENALLNNAIINAYANQANMFMPYGIPVNSYYGNGEGLQEALLEYNEPVNSEGLEEYIQNTTPYFTSGAGGRFVPYIPRFTNGVGGRFAEGGEMQMSPEEAAMMQLQGAEGMPPEMAGGMPAGAEQGIPVPLEGGMPPEMMGGQEQMSLEEMEEQQYEEERRAAFEEAREEAREEGKKTFEFEGRIYVTETGQLVNNEKACGGRLHGYGGNMFAYGGLDGPEPDAFNVGPTDPPYVELNDATYVANNNVNPYRTAYNDDARINNTYLRRFGTNFIGGPDIYPYWNITGPHKDNNYTTSYFGGGTEPKKDVLTPYELDLLILDNIRQRNYNKFKRDFNNKRAEGGPLDYDIEEPYPYDEGYTPEQAYQQQLFNDLEAQRREAYNQLIKNRIKERLLREYGITEDELNASRRREVRKKKKSKK